MPRLSRVLAASAVTAAAAALLPAAASASSGPPRYVSLGDSYTSGPFIPRQTGRPADCLRSTRNYPRLAAAALGDSLTDVSCAGATTADMTSPQSVPLGTNPPQLSALSPATSLVTLQIGGNDIGFLSIVATCAELSFTDPYGSPCKDYYTSGGTDQLAQAVRATAPKVAAVLAGIGQRAPRARVLVAGYPVILPASGSGCWPAVPIAHGDVPYLRGVEQRLNRMLAAEAAAHGAGYLDTYTPSIGHDVCEPRGRRWVEGIAPTSPAAPVHPNELGEQNMARAVLAAVG